MQLHQALVRGELGLHKTKSAEMPSVGTLRGLQWRLHLDVLPSNSSTIDQLRQAAADGRRRYAELRRRLLVDPHAMEEPHRSLADIDNPLSQNPDSVWSRYFQNAEIERTIDTDLTRLYPEHESFFQNPSCQAMLRRILLVWSLTHPQYSYRQGMHELLAPLLYVLHIDAMHLLQIKQQNEDLFDDRFEGPLLLEPNILGNRKWQTSQHLTLCNTYTTPNSKCSEEWQEIRAPRNKPQLKVDETGFDFKIMVLGSDTYGAEGELGALLSARFVEHDAYVMFDALMTGKGWGVKMADYFLPTNGSTSITGLSPVLEASYSIYRVLAAADLTLYNHLIELRVEPQFFAMRWLRVLFGREFDLDKILLLWDAIFLVVDKNESSTSKEDNGSFQHSSRRDFILAVAVSMLLYLRQTLLAVPSATDCLKKLLNFPQNADVEILIESANFLTLLVESTARTVPSSGQSMATYENGKSKKSPQSGDNIQTISTRNKFLRTPSFSPEILKKPLPDSYWEEKWKKSVLQKALPWIDEETLSTPGNTHKIAAKCLSLTEAHLNSKGGLPDLVDRPSSQTTLPDVLNKGNVERFYTDSMKGTVLAHLQLVSKLTPGFKQSSRPWLPSGDALEGRGNSSHKDLTSVSTSNGNLCHTSASPKSTTQDPVSHQLSAGDRSFDTNAAQSSVNNPSIESGSTALSLIPNLQESSNIAASNDSPVTSQSRKNWIWKLGSGSREKRGLFSASKTDRGAINGSATSEGLETLSKLKESLHSQDSTLPFSKEQKDVSFRDELLDPRFSINPSHAVSAIEGQSLKFEALAQCISDNIQVIEDAFTKMDSCESKCSIKDSEVSTLSQKDNLECLSGKTTFEDVQAALSELRKISTALLQM